MPSSSATTTIRKQVPSLQIDTVIANTYNLNLAINSNPQDLSKTDLPTPPGNPPPTPRRHLHYNLTPTSLIGNELSKKDPPTPPRNPPPTPRRRPANQLSNQLSKSDPPTPPRNPPPTPRQRTVLPVKLDFWTDIRRDGIEHAGMEFGTEFGLEIESLSKKDPPTPPRNPPPTPRRRYVGRGFDYMQGSRQLLSTGVSTGLSTTLLTADYAVPDHAGADHASAARARAQARAPSGNTMETYQSHRSYGGSLEAPFDEDEVPALSCGSSLDCSPVDAMINEEDFHFHSADITSVPTRTNETANPAVHKAVHKPYPSGKQPELPSLQEWVSALEGRDFDLFSRYGCQQVTVAVA